MKNTLLYITFKPHLKYRVFQIDTVLIEVYHFFVLQRRIKSFLFGCKYKQKNEVHKFVGHNFVYHCIFCVYQRHNQQYPPIT